MQLPIIEVERGRINYIPVRELWLNHSAGTRGIAAVLRGFIDESHDGSAVPKLFTLACLVSDDSMWPWFEMAWVKVLEEKNEQLKKENRTLLTRYHAADCSSLRGEFTGWTVEEQKEFVIKLFHVFEKHPVHIHSYDMPLQLLVQEFPETKPNPVGFAYVVLLTMLMDQIGQKTLSLYPKEVISLHHDHCGYDAALAEAFGRIIDDPRFQWRNRFTSITPEYWQHCVPLQPADLIAYENFKEGTRCQESNLRPKRKSFEVLFNLDSISGRASGFGLEAIRELKGIIGGLDSQMKNILFTTARIYK